MAKAIYGSAESRALYEPQIENVDVRAGLFRECEAMVAHAGACGAAVPEEVGRRLGFLDIGIERRAEIPMGELLTAHAGLAAVIEPATPRSIELMRWDARQNPFLHRIAPVTALRRLLVIALLFIVLFCALPFSGALNAENVLAPLLSLRAGEGIWLLLFYFALAGIGASFKCLYDAYQYVRQGKYDQRLDSTYYIRIGLGLIAGLMLAQVLNQFVETGTAESMAAENPGLLIGKPVLALLGGFSAEFVYRVLSRLIEAADSLFRPRVDQQLEMQARELRASAARVDADRRAALAGRAAAVASALEVEQDPSRRTGLVDELVDVVLPGFKRQTAGVAGTGPLAKAASTVDGLIAKAERAAALGSVVVDLLPEERTGAARDFVRGARAAVDEVASLRRRVAGGDVSGAALQVLERLTRSDETPLVGVLQKALGTFGPILAKLSPALGLAGPAGMVLGIVGVGARLGDAAYTRWKVRILDAPYEPNLLPPASITSNSIIPAIKLSPVFAEAFADLLEEGGPQVVEVGELALAEDGTALRARFADRFPDPAQFDLGLAEFRRAMLGALVASEVPDDVVAKAQAPNAEALVAALDALRDDATARDDLELLALLGDRVRTGEVAMEDVEASLVIAEEKS
ncbi:MAG: hypothetical protein AAFX81_13155 [Pseudomonadota bacterium]